MDLGRLGYDEGFAADLAALGEPAWQAGRVIRPGRKTCLVGTVEGEIQARVTGRLRYEAQCTSELPVVGDWVAFKPAQGTKQGCIQALLPRRSCFRRKAPGLNIRQQALAANIDTVFLMTALDRDFSPRRLERYLTLAWDSGADPVVLLSKADLCDDVAGHCAAAEAAAPGIGVHAIAALENHGLDAVAEYLRPGKTVVVLGSSGVGKSTLVNVLLGEERLEVGAVGERDGKGKHTTTNKQLLTLPCGSLMIDTPGLRELQLWTEADSLEAAFSDIEELGAACKFRDCQHQDEPGCAVRAAMETGELCAERLESYQQLRAELKSLAHRTWSGNSKRGEQAKWKKGGQLSKRPPRRKS